MDKFWELLAESVIVQGVVTVSLVGACIYLALVNQPIPDLLSSATMLALGFYFGSKSQMAIATQAKLKEYKE